MSDPKGPLVSMLVDMLIEQRARVLFLYRQTTLREYDDETADDYFARADVRAALEPYTKLAERHELPESIRGWVKR